MSFARGWYRCIGVALALGLVGACWGAEFSSEAPRCQGADCAAAGEPQSAPGGQGGDRAGQGGAQVGSAGRDAGGDGGSSGGGDDAGAGTGALGGTLGLAGSVGVAGGGTGPSFPMSPVLDDFNRAGPQLGAAWIGAPEEYALLTNRLQCESCTQAALWAEPFAAAQEVFARLAAFDQSATEINLVLRAQGSPSCELIELIYSPVSLELRVAYCVEGTWTDLEETQVLLKAGDQLGARSYLDDQLQVFVNGQPLRRYDISGFPFKLGRIGVNGVSGDNGLAWDDFGGGEWR